MCKAFVPTIFLICVLSLTTTAHASESQDCRLKQYASLDLLELRNGYLLVPVTIQDAPGFMILNTATALSSLTETAANLLALSMKPVPSGVKVHSGAKSVDKVATAKGFAIGNMHFNTIEFVVIPNTIHTDASDVQVSGILGMDVFANVDIDLDVANKKLNLFSPDHCPGQAVYWSTTYDSAPIHFGRLGEFYFPMELDGKKLETTLATGNSTTTLSTDVTRKLYNFDRHSPGIETETNRIGGTIDSYRAMKLSGEGVQVVNAHIILFDRPTNDSCHLGSRSGAAAYEDCYGVHPLQLGRNVLSKLHIYVATKEKVLYFTPSSASVQR